jgi:DUF4097 and DUF4098 domain-containing protein YvlB
MKLGFFLAISTALSSNAHAETVTKEFMASEIRQLDLSNHSGKISISVTNSAKAVVSANKIEFEKDCALTIDQKNSTLVVAVKNSSSFSKSKCHVDLTLQVPQEIAMALTSGSGPIQVNGTKGSISYKTGSGSVDIAGDVSKLDGKSGSSTINIAGLSGEADLKSGSGEITIRYEKKIEKGSLSVTSGSGNVTVYVPADTKLKSSFKAGSGQLSNEVGDTPNAQFTITAKAGSGNLTIKKAQ